MRLPETVAGRLQELADAQIARDSMRFFKTGRGEYGAGDRFLGIRMPQLRMLARQYRDASADDALCLLRSEWHEQRLLALLLLTAAFERAENGERTRIYRRYIASVANYVNNWDLVDTSAPAIVGGYLERRSRRPLFALARSPNLWRRRVAIIATLRLIKQGSYDDTLALAELLLGDAHDLIHKATGWALREVGNRDREALARFLDRHHAKMPRTMLRYAIERLPARERRRYLRRRS